MVLFVLLLWSTGTGVYKFEQPWWEIMSGSAAERYVLLNVRLPRVVMAVLIGSGLAVAGSSLQGLFRNPLATPDLIGVTAGATLMAAFTIVLGDRVRPFLPEVLHFSLLSIAAFVGALCSIYLVFRMATAKGKTDVVIMLLSGVALSALGFSLVGMMTYLAKDEQLRDLTFWNLGSLGGATWTKNGILALVLAVTYTYLLFQGKALNALMLGEKDAEHLGIRIEKVKRITVLCVALIVGTSVAFAGSINFIGLVVPYVLRLWIGANYVHLLPFSAVWGAVLLLGSDTVSRTAVAPAELPVGILTALIGAPVFLVILLQYKKNRQW